MLFGDDRDLPNDDAAATAQSEAERDDATALRLRIHQHLLDLLNLSALEKATRETLRAQIRGPVTQFIRHEKRLFADYQLNLLIEDVLDELLGLGPIEPLLKDNTISDILVNTSNVVYVERRGQLEMTNVRFQDTRHLIRIINKIVSAVGRRIDESQPMVDARLADGSRINAIIPPLAIDGPLVSIRKFSRDPISMPKLIEFNSVSEEMARCLSICVQARRNVLISGGTGTGKTTILNALSAFIDNRERVITIEDSAELQLQQPHVCRLETRPANIEGKGETTQRELVRNALRMRPDRIIVGEVRSGEAFDMLQAMNTGHDGSMTTVHANSARDALARVEQMVGMAGLDITLRSIRQQIASAINVVIQLERMEDGSRRVVSISEVTGMELDTILMQEIFVYHRRGRDSEGRVLGEFEPTGIRPKFLERALYRGIDLEGLSFDVSRPNRKPGR
jgi:pilus assembly protein CpaF